MSTSVEHETGNRSPKKSLIIGLIVTTVIAAVVTISTSITPGFDWLDGLLIGGVIFVCGTIPIVYLYRLRAKRAMEFEDK